MKAREEPQGGTQSEEEGRAAFVNVEKDVCEEASSPRT